MPEDGRDHREERDGERENRRINHTSVCTFRGVGVCACVVGGGGWGIFQRLGH